MSVICGWRNDWEQQISDGRSSTGARPSSAATPTLNRLGLKAADSDQARRKQEDRPSMGQGRGQDPAFGADDTRDTALP